MKNTINYYNNELKALKRSGRYRERHLRNNDLIDCASNDYLGLAQNAEVRQKSIAAYECYSQTHPHAPMASMLVNGYHEAHYAFEQELCRVNGFEEGVILGSGFNANIALIEALVRRGDTLFIDEKYHASGMLATKYLDADVVIFKHNDPQALRYGLQKSTSRRNIVAVEGIYSMDADLLDKEIIEIADEFEALLIIDEAHSSGVIGAHLMGAYDYHDITIKPNHIKMGTLGKAYGSFGAYILASSHIIDFLINRAKPIIYATAPSLFDTIMGHESLKYIIEHSEKIKQNIVSHQDIVYQNLDIKVAGLIVPIVVGDNNKVIMIQNELKELGYHVGAIRQPTVDKAIIRVIARLNVSTNELDFVTKKIKELLLCPAEEVAR
jgi:8-amino-7-oxononanoate synthase